MADDDDAVLNPGDAEEAFESDDSADDEEMDTPEGTQFDEFGKEEE